MNNLEVYTQAFTIILFPLLSMAGVAVSYFMVQVWKLIKNLQERATCLETDKDDLQNENRLLINRLRSLEFNDRMRDKQVILIEEENKRVIEKMNAVKVENERVNEENIKYLIGINKLIAQVLRHNSQPDWKPE